MKRTIVASVLSLSCISFATWNFAVAKPIPDPPHILDMRPGEFVSDMLARSTYPLENIRLVSTGMSQILLTPFETERPRTPVITLHFGANQTTLPFVPARGDLYSTQGMVSELELGFYNFPDLAHDGQRDMSTDFDAEVIGSPEPDIEAILALFDSLRIFGWSGDQSVFCAPKIAVPTAYDDCIAEREVNSDWPTGQELRTALNRYREDLDNAWATDDWDTFVDPDPVFVLGQWVTDDDVRIKFSVLNRFEIAHGMTLQNAPPSARKRSLRVTLGINAYPTGLARRTDECFNRHMAEGEIIPPFRRYTPLEAKNVHGGLLASLLIASDDTTARLGDTTAQQLPENLSTWRQDLANLNALDKPEREARLNKSCEHLPRLEDVSGYTGPR